MNDELEELLYRMAEVGEEANLIRCVFTTICVYNELIPDTSVTDELLMETWDNLMHSDSALSFYSKYADNDRDDEYELSNDPLMARYENGFENYMLEYLI